MKQNKQFFLRVATELNPKRIQYRISHNKGPKVPVEGRLPLTKENVMGKTRLLVNTLKSIHRFEYSKRIKGPYIRAFGKKYPKDDFPMCEGAIAHLSHQLNKQLNERIRLIARYRFKDWPKGTIKWFDMYIKKVYKNQKFENIVFRLIHNSKWS